MRLHIVIGCLALAACSEGTPPESGFTGTYQLVLVNDRGLPAVIEIVGFSGTEHRLVAGDLVFAGGRAIERTAYDSRPRTGEPTPTYFDSTQARFAIDGTSIFITRHWRNDSTTVDTGYVEGDLLILPQRLKNSLNIATSSKYTLKFARQQ